MTCKTILVTRPAGDEETLTQSLHELGHRVIHEPLTEIFLRHTARQELENALANDPDALIVTSRHGVRALAALTELRDLLLICVGEATAAVAHSLGFARAYTESADVEQLIDHVAVAYDEDTRFLYVSAEQVSLDLAEALAPLGMSVERLVLYDAVAATDLSEILIEHLKRGQIDAVTFLSQRAATIFDALLQKADMQEAAKSMEAFALSEAIAATLRDQAWRAVHVASEPELASMIECVDNALASEG